MKALVLDWREPAFAEAAVFLARGKRIIKVFPHLAQRVPTTVGFVPPLVRA